MPLDLVNMLSWWQWLILAAAPPAIIALYFLKLKRRPLEVPSTYLWRRSIEDLHVNTIWQRLRRNLLLFLQLLLLLLIMLAVLRPGVKGARLVGNRFVFLIDNSASMQATDLGEPRLEAAKQAARETIERMQPGDVAMVVSFSEIAEVEQEFTSNRRQLIESVAQIAPSARATSLREAIKLASGLANPGRSANDDTDVQVAEPKPATLYIFSDGRFADPAARLGNLEPVYRPIGADAASNVGIAVLNVRRNESRPDQSQAFARLENYSQAVAEVALELWLDGEMIDAARFQIPPGESQGFQRDLGPVQAGRLRLAITKAEFLHEDGGRCDDQLAVDNEAWAAVRKNRPANLLLVTPGCEAIRLALTTELAGQLANVTIESPEVLDKDGDYARQAASGAYDLIIYDRCRPREMPHANTFFVGALPPISVRLPPDREAGEPEKVDLWRAGPEVAGPRIIDIDAAHPLTGWLDLDDVLIAKARPLEVPAGGTVLIDSHLGPLMAVAPRGGLEDLVLAFSFLEEETGDDGAVRRFAATNWPIRTSFPVFMLNLLHYFGGGQAGLDTLSVQPGRQVSLQSPAAGEPLQVIAPSGRKVALPVGDLGRASFGETDELGVYEVRSRGAAVDFFSVNLFDPAESNIAVRQQIQLGHVPVEGRTAGWQSARRELWKACLLAGLGILLLEWWVYSRRVSV
ncbi:MAG: VWA domain-containing protein [Pirellulales bacterium]|jgi:hypothetical protein|nr:VWA domain-containing protein [Thermoguttaceae bacterium]MDD4785877.1 VWA domain-containing protein [Pirellulales bacterium]NLY99965.1 VWA domain-containing protein [Pirellulaceae bacterium]